MPLSPKSSLFNVVFATRNKGKIREAANIARNTINFLPMPVEVPEIDEPFNSYLENALHKARIVSHYTNLPVLAEDSGINVIALDGAPGIYSARYASLSGEKNNEVLNYQKLLQDLQGKPDRRAYYVCCCVLIQSSNDPHPLVTQGFWWGHIAQCPVGEHGFGYDPIFWLEHLGKTAAELSPQHKNQLSHRTQALEKMILEVNAIEKK